MPRRYRKSRRPRDSQKMKVYRAENNAFADWPQRFKDVREVKEFMLSVMRNDYIKEQYGMLGHVHISFGGNSRIAKHFFKGSSNHKFRLPTWSWYSPMILHELSHGYTYQNHSFNGIQGHGPEFCKTYLDLVGHFIDVGAKRKLVEEFAHNKVKW